LKAGNPEKSVINREHNHDESMYQPG